MQEYTNISYGNSTLQTCLVTGMSIIGIEEHTSWVMSHDMKQYQALFRYHKLVWETEVIPCIYTCLYRAASIPGLYLPYMKQKHQPWT
jgi:hypothetical protein